MVRLAHRVRVRVGVTVEVRRGENGRLGPSAEDVDVRDSAVERECAALRLRLVHVHHIVLPCISCSFPILLLVAIFANRPLPRRTRNRRGRKRDTTCRRSRTGDRGERDPSGLGDVSVDTRCVRVRHRDGRGGLLDHRQLEVHLEAAGRMGVGPGRERVGHGGRGVDELHVGRWDEQDVANNDQRSSWTVDGREKGQRAAVVVVK